LARISFAGGGKIDLRAVRKAYPVRAEYYVFAARYRERGRELAWEGHRRDDQIRFGTYGGTWEFKESSDANHRIFPIPDWVRDGAPGVYTQNPGY
jgi:hypothetical protein